MSTGNPVRTCIGCAQKDDHPRHVIAVADGSVNWHMDCHVIAANCDVCAAQIADAAGATGETLRAHLLTTASDPGSPGWTSPDHLEG